MRIGILEMRNHHKVRKQMHSQDIINKKDHLEFIDSLKSNNSKKYFAVKYKQQVLGVLNFTSINVKYKSAMFGVYSNLLKKIDKAGSILMEAALTYFKNILFFEKLLLEVYESNHKAVRLYSKFNFVVVDRLYHDNNRVLIMNWIKRTS